MPKILNADIAKTLADVILSKIRSDNPELSDAQIRAVLNTAASLTNPFVKKSEQVTEDVTEPVSEDVTEPVSEDVTEPVTEEFAESFQ